ncbi:MAG: galactokinase family protein [Odoribacter splanchnicus]
MNTLELEHRFEEIYGKTSGAYLLCSSSVNLIGEHTDYNGGLVFPVR